jgi:dihydroneopterin aldolase
MTKLLAKANSSADASQALAGGAELLDISDAPLEARASLLAGIGGRVPVVALSPGEGVTFVRGVLPMAGARTVATIFAEDHGIADELASAKANGAVAALLTTATRKHLYALLTPPEVAGFVAGCREHGLEAWIGGNLEPPDVPRVLMMEPDVICLDRPRDDQFRALIPLKDRQHSSAVDFARAKNVEPELTLKILVRDFVLPAVIGAYGHEHGKPQRVRFNVEAEVRRSPHIPQDMRDVFSYDIILDTIRTLVAQGHITLVEAMAERIAQAILQYKDILAVTVRVEKLDLGPGAVGVEILRKRASREASVAPLFREAGEAR